MSCVQDWFQELCLWLIPAEVPSLCQLYEPGNEGGLAGREGPVLRFGRRVHTVASQVAEWRGSTQGAGKRRLRGGDETYW